MARTVKAGLFYEFDRSSEGREVGRVLHRAFAISRVRAGRDVYTLLRGDAFALAQSVYHRSTVAEHGAHKGSYFRHFHPAFNKVDGFGHIFFEERGAD